MNVTIDGTTATLDLEEYSDLLAVRTLPDYRFVGEASVECDAIDLEAGATGTKNANARERAAGGDGWDRTRTASS